MRLQIEHQTLVALEDVVNHSIQYLRLTPRTDSNQLVYSWQITTKGSLDQWTDGFGNYCHTFIHSGEHDEVVVTVKGEVETTDTAGVLPAEDEHWPLAFLRDTPLTAATSDVRAFCVPFHDQLVEEGSLNTMHALMRAIAKKVKYQPGFQQNCATAGETLNAKKAGCQDHAHLFIACCRALGLPARYVSGYLYVEDADEKASKGKSKSGTKKPSGVSATHAWAEVLIKDLGWVSFDPANNQSATESYVRLAVGFDYASACPMRGLLDGEASEKLRIRVKAKPRRKAPAKRRRAKASQSQSQSQS